MIDLSSVGSPAQIVAALALLGILAKQVIPWKKISVDAATQLRDELTERNKILIARVERCEKECEDHKEELRTQILSLQQQRLDDRAANLQEQISLVSILVKNVESPLLAKILEQLQATKSKLPYVLTGVKGDAQTSGK